MGKIIRLAECIVLEKRKDAEVMRRNLTYQKENIFLTNFTYRRKYDYLLYLRLAPICEDYHQGKSELSRNSYVKQAMMEKFYREEQGVYLEIPKSLYAPFPKERQFKVQFTISINHLTEKELYHRVQKLARQGTSVLDFVRDALYEKMVMEQTETDDKTMLRFALVLNEQEDRELISFLRTCLSETERELFIKQSLRSGLLEREQHASHRR